MACRQKKKKTFFFPISKKRANKFCWPFFSTLGTKKCDFFLAGGPKILAIFGWPDLARFFLGQHSDMPSTDAPTILTCLVSPFLFRFSIFVFSFVFLSVSNYHFLLFLFYFLDFVFRLLSSFFILSFSFFVFQSCFRFPFFVF